MAKLLEKNGAEMAVSLVKIATPLKNFLDDAEFDKAFKNATKKGVEARMTDIIQIYSDLAPLLLGEKHLKDTLAILAEVEGTTVSKLLKMNGAELLADAIKAINEQIKPFFTLLGGSAGEKL